MITGGALLIFPKQFQMGYLKLERDYGARRYPPLGLMYISSALKEIGIRPELIDMTALSITLEDIVKKITAGNYLFVGFYADTTTRCAVLDYVKLIKKHKNIQILIGGPSSQDPEFFLENEGVAVIHGEGEETVKKIALRLDSGKDFSGIKGVSYKKDGILFSDKITQLVENLNSIPFPDRDAIDTSKYQDYYNLNYKGPFATIITSRGCPTNCVYCTSSNFWGRRVRFRSVSNVIDEIKYLKSKYNTRYVDFVDDIFNLNKKWLDEFCSKLISEKLSIHWSCNMYPFEMPLDLLMKAKASGGNTIKLGIQSADENVLTNINRNPKTVEDAKVLIRNAKKAGFLIYLDFIFGLPGETRESLLKNMDFSVKVNPAVAKFYKLDILEGSELSNRAKQNMKITDLSDNEIREFCKIAWKKFYFRPGKVFEFMRIYLKNPSMFKIALRHLNIASTFMGK